SASCSTWSRTPSWCSASPRRTPNCGSTGRPFGAAPSERTLTMKLKRIISIDYHRNGIGGAPFHAILFEDRGEDGSRKVAVVFAAPWHTAVLDVDKLAAGDIAFGSNSWRGDVFEPALRKAIAKRIRAIEADIRGGQR